MLVAELLPRDLARTRAVRAVASCGAGHAVGELAFVFLVIVKAAHGVAIVIAVTRVETVAHELVRFHVLADPVSATLGLADLDRSRALEAAQTTTRL